MKITQIDIVLQIIPFILCLQSIPLWNTFNALLFLQIELIFLLISTWLYKPFFKDINECSSDTCENGGTCTDEVDGYVCDCVPGFTGMECQTGIEIVLHLVTKNLYAVEQIKGFKNRFQIHLPKIFTILQYYYFCIHLMSFCETKFLFSHLVSTCDKTNFF